MFPERGETMQFPDPRALEASTAALMKRIEKEGLTEPEEINELLTRIQAESMEQGVAPEFKPDTPLERAQALMYEAFGTNGTRKRVSLAKKALKISPDCADAYVVLAEETAKDLEQAKDLFQHGVEAGERALGPDVFEEYAGEFWGLLQARPYMRALQGLAEAENYLGNYQRAAELYHKILRLNAGDNQGARYALLSTLLQIGDTTGARKLLRQYKDDAAASWPYGLALVTFLDTGNTKQSRARLQEAIKRNPFFAAYLTGVLELPEHPPEYMDYGGETEGQALMLEQGGVWLSNPAAMDWLVDSMISMGPPAGWIDTDS